MLIFSLRPGLGWEGLKYLLKKPHLTKLSTRDILEVFDVSRITLTFYSFHWRHLCALYIDHFDCLVLRFVIASEKQPYQVKKYPSS